MGIKKINIDGATLAIAANASNVDYNNNGTPSNVKDTLDEILEGGLVERELASRNIFDVSTMVQSGKTVNDTTGAVENSTTGSAVVTIPVTGGQVYCYRLPTHFHASAAGLNIPNATYNKIHEYDDEGNHLGIVTEYSSNEGGYLFKASDDAVEIRFAVSSRFISALDGLMIERGTVVHDYEPYSAQYLDGLNDNRIGAEYPSGYYLDLPHNIVFMGDSIMSEAQGQWYTHFLEKFPTKWSVNLSVGKAMWAHKSTTAYDLTANPNANNVITNQVNRLINGVSGGAYPQPDIVFIHCGINDRVDGDTNKADDADVSSLYGDPSAIFDFSNSATAHSSYWLAMNDPNGRDYGNEILRTLTGGMRFAIEILRAAFPWVKIIMTTPLYTGGVGTGNSYYKVRHINRIIKECCSYLSVPVIDITYELGIYPPHGAYNLIDSLHPNTGGGRMIADLVGHELVRRFGKYTLYDNRHYTITGHIYCSDGTTPVPAYVQGSSGAMLTLARQYTTYQYLFSGANGVIVDEHGNKGVSIPAGFYKIVQEYPSGNTNILAYLDLDEDKELNLVTNIQA